MASSAAIGFIAASAEHNEYIPAGEVDCCALLIHGVIKLLYVGILSF